MNKTITKVYKVVKRVPIAYGNDILYSFCACGKMARVYEIGMVTKPRRGTKLFAFTNKKQAFEYALGKNAVFAVYSAEATNAHHNGWINFHCTVEEVRDLFAGKVEMETPEDRFNSSVVCDSIKLIKLEAKH